MNTLIRIIISSLVTLLSFQASAQNNYTITVKVEGAESNDGKMFIALYDTATNFLDKSYKGEVSDIKNKSCTVVFKDIPKGTYAVSMFHDENDNGKFDTNFFGFPSEDYGCSNDARGIMGPPRWKDAKFELNENKSITIHL